MFKKRSIYISLALVIVTTIVLIMSINASLNYMNTKTAVINSMKDSSRTTILSLKNNISNLITSYAVNEYDKLILNEISRKDIYALIVHDYNMGKIMGEKEYITGKIKDNEGQVIDFDTKNKEHLDALKSVFYSVSYDIIDNNKALGKISIYISDEQMNNELNEIISNTIKNTIVISALLFFTLFVSIRSLLLKPLSRIVQSIHNRDEDGIPKNPAPHHDTKEIDELATSMNRMIQTVRSSQNTLKTNEEELSQALELQTRIFDASSYIMVRCDKAGIIQQINKEAERVLGYKPEELINKFTPEIFHLKSEVILHARALEQEYNQPITKGMDVFTFKANMGLRDDSEWTIITKEGKHIPIILSVSALRDNNNEIFGYIGISQDISERKLFESQSKLASMGEMMGNIAHQWRQPLSVISTTASGLHLRSNIEEIPREDIMDKMQSITQQTQYLSNTIDDFRNFIKDSNDKEEISVVQSVEQAISIIASSLHNNGIELHKDLKHDIKIQGFKNQLIQVFINIINNAKDAILEHQFEEDQLIFVETFKNEDSLTVSIKDNGGGIEEHIIDRIFEPYFTTKHQSVGTGIGLSMVHQIITQNHHAQITVTNETYHYNNMHYIGACFQITFKS